MQQYNDYDFLCESAREAAYHEVTEQFNHLETLLADHQEQGIISRANVVLTAHMCHRDAKLYGGEKCLCGDTETAKRILEACPINNQEYHKQIAEWELKLEFMFERERELAGTFRDYFN